MGNDWIPLGLSRDVTLNDDGAVQEVKVIEGNPLLNIAASDAVNQWKYPAAYGARQANE